MAETNKGELPLFAEEGRELPLFAPFDSLVEGRDALDSVIDGIRPKHQRFEVLMVLNRYLSTIQERMPRRSAPLFPEEQASDESSS